MTYEQLSRKISHHLIDSGGDGQLTPVLRLTAGAGACGVQGCRGDGVQGSEADGCAAMLLRSWGPLFLAHRLVVGLAAGQLPGLLACGLSCLASPCT